MTDTAQRKSGLNVNAADWKPVKSKVRPKKVSNVSSNGKIKLDELDKLTRSLTEPSRWKDNKNSNVLPHSSQTKDDMSSIAIEKEDIDQLISAVESGAFQQSLPSTSGYAINSSWYTQRQHYAYSQHYDYPPYGYYNNGPHSYLPQQHQQQMMPSHQPPPPQPQGPKGPRVKAFEPKTGSNHSKGNFYISEEMIISIVKRCKEPFDSFKKNDEGLAFSYFKQSVAMSINDGQIRIVESTGGEVILIDIDLHFKDDEKMFFVAVENEKDHIQQMKWRIKDVMNKKEILNIYPDIPDSYFPKSSRKMKSFESELRFDPYNVQMHFFDGGNPQVFKPCHKIKQTKSFHKLPKKYPKDKGKTAQITNHDFLRACDKTFRSANYKKIPVVIIKGKRTWIEWKIPIKVMNDEYMCVSLKYNSSNAQWVFSCLDFDAGCLYYKHRLVGLAPNDPKNFSFDEVKKYCTISLEFV